MNILQDYIKAAEEVSMFCRMNMNAKRQLPIRASEMGLLILIVKSSETYTPVQAADFFKVSKPMVTSMINTLSKNDYLTKISSQADRRSFVIQPTQKAIDLVEEMYTEYHHSILHLREKMGAEEFEKFIILLSAANKILLEVRENE